MNFLKKNIFLSFIFECAAKLYMQKSGTVIGTKMAPSYANVLLSTLESEILAEFPYKLEIWLKFIDDIG